MAVATKVDMKKEMKELYQPSSRQVSLVTVPAINYLMIDGRGDPRESFGPDIEMLYALAYTIKQIAKPLGIDFTVMPSEALYWSAGRKKLNVERKDGWRWTLMLALPPQIKKTHFSNAVKQVEQKKGLPLRGRVRMERFREGKAVEIMHIGPYEQEGPTIQKLIDWARDNGFRVEGKHHEIYLSDPRRTAPKKLKTVVRLPVVRK